MVTPKRYSWDACTWIALIIQEQALRKGGGLEDRARLCNHIINQAASKRVEIATSGLSLAEVCKHPDVIGADGDVLSDFFRNEYILVVPVDRFVGTLAREIMQGRQPGLKPPDAIHLATAIISGAAEFHTFDDRLLALDQKLERRDSGLLTICKPPPPPPSLFDQ